MNVIHSTAGFNFLERHFEKNQVPESSATRTAAAQTHVQQAAPRPPKPNALTEALDNRISDFAASLEEFSHAENKEQFLSERPGFVTIISRFLFGYAKVQKRPVLWVEEFLDLTKELIEENCKKGLRAASQNASINSVLNELLQGKEPTVDIVTLLLRICSQKNMQNDLRKVFLAYPPSIFDSLKKIPTSESINHLLSRKAQVIYKNFTSKTDAETYAAKLKKQGAKVDIYEKRGNYSVSGYFYSRYDHAQVSQIEQFFNTEAPKKKIGWEFIQRKTDSFDFTRLHQKTARVFGITVPYYDITNEEYQFVVHQTIEDKEELNLKTEQLLQQMQFISCSCIDQNTMMVQHLASGNCPNSAFIFSVDPRNILSTYSSDQCTPNGNKNGEMFSYLNDRRMFTASINFVEAELQRGTKETSPQKQPLDVAAEIDTLCPKFCEPFADPNNLLLRTSTYNEVVLLDNTFRDITHGNPTHIKAIAYPKSCFDKFCLNAHETASHECRCYRGNDYTTERIPDYTPQEVQMYKSLFTYIVNNKIPMVIVNSETADKAPADAQELRSQEKNSSVEE